MESYMLPRNLNKPDTIIYSPIELNWKQIAYIAVGVGGTYLAFNTGMPVVYKIVTSACSFGAGLFAAMYKYKGSSIDELAVDSLIYAQRKAYYTNMSKRSDLVVTVKPKKETGNESQQSISKYFSIQSS